MNNEISLLSLQGQLDALTHLCAAMAAFSTPAASLAVISGAKESIEKIKKSGKPTLYVSGYEQAGKAILAALEVASGAEQIGNLSGDVKH